MNCTKYYGGRLAVACVVVAGLLATAAPAGATLIVDDSWADGGRTNGADLVSFSSVASPSGAESTSRLRHRR